MKFTVPNGDTDYVMNEKGQSLLFIFQQDHDIDEECFSGEDCVIMAVDGEFVALPRLYSVWRKQLWGEFSRQPQFSVDSERMGVQAGVPRGAIGIPKDAKKLSYHDCVACWQNSIEILEESGQPLYWFNDKYIGHAHRIKVDIRKAS